MLMVSASTWSFPTASHFLLRSISSGSPPPLAFALLPLSRLRLPSMSESDDSSNSRWALSSYVTSFVRGRSRRGGVPVGGVGSCTCEWRERGGGEATREGIGVGGGYRSEWEGGWVHGRVSVRGEKGWSLATVYVWSTARSRTGGRRARAGARGVGGRGGRSPPSMYGARHGGGARSEWEGGWVHGRVSVRGEKGWSLATVYVWSTARSRTGGRRARAGARGVGGRGGRSPPSMYGARHGGGARAGRRLAAVYGARGTLERTSR